MSEAQCYFGVQLNTQCHKLEFSRTTWTVKLTDLEDIQEILVWRAGLANNLFSSSAVVWKCVWEKS